MAQSMDTGEISGMFAVSILSSSSRVRKAVALHIAPDRPTSCIDTHCSQLVRLRSHIHSH